jgi:hypothetical protein
MTVSVDNPIRYDIGRYIVIGSRTSLVGGNPWNVFGDTLWRYTLLHSLEVHSAKCGSPS